MNRLFLFVAFLLATMLAFATQPTANEETASTRPTATTVAQDAVRAAETAFAATMAARDHGAFASFLAEDAVFLSEHAVLRSADEVAAGWKPLFEGEGAPFSWAPERVEVLASGGLAVSTGPVKDPAGNQVGTFVSTWRREEDGTWKVVLDTGCRCDCP